MEKRGGVSSGLDLERKARLPEALAKEIAGTSEQSSSQKTRERLQNGFWKRTRRRKRLCTAVRKRRLELRESL